jgi:hypothetical protein
MTVDVMEGRNRRRADGERKEPGLYRSPSNAGWLLTLNTDDPEHPPLVLDRILDS